jgi:NCS1 family nucleobase:cation symporter-1
VEQISLHFTPALAYSLLLVIIIATFSVNVFANSVAPGYDIANTYSKRLTWFRGILIGVALSLFVGAYTAYSSSAHNYIYNWLLAYGALLGGVEGVIAFDYFFVRRFKFEPQDVFKTRGHFRYLGGVNPAAVIAFVVGIVVTYINKWGISNALWAQFFYDNSWITAFVISGIVYLVLMQFWVVPKYQPWLKGNVAKGYTDDEIDNIFKKTIAQK